MTYVSPITLILNTANDFDNEPTFLELDFWRGFFYGSLLLFMLRVFHAFLSVHCALWSIAGKGLTSWLACVCCFIVFLSLSRVVSWVKCDT